MGPQQVLFVSPVILLFVFLFSRQRTNKGLSKDNAVSLAPCSLKARSAITLEIMVDNNLKLALYLLSSPSLPIYMSNSTEAKNEAPITSEQEEIALLLAPTSSSAAEKNRIMK